MQYVKVIGDTHAEAMKKLRDTYGPEAIIYYEKEIPAKTVISRMVGKKQFMIQAALTEKKPLKKGARDGNKNSLGPMSALASASNFNSEGTSKTIDPVVLPQIRSKHDGQEFLNLLESSNIRSVSKELNLEDISIENEIYSLNNDQSFNKNNLLSSGSKSFELKSIREDIDVIKKKISILVKTPKQEYEKREEPAQLDIILRNQNFSEKWITGFLEIVKSSLTESQLKNPEAVLQQAEESLAACVRCNANVGTKRVVMLMGTTGVGKTTTIAKLASRLKLKENKKISLVTLDNFRIAATEQLKVYADILDTPFHVIKDPKKFQRFITEDTSDIILVDTTGVSQHNREFILKQKEYFFESRFDVEKHLLLSSTSRFSDTKEIIKSFDMIGIDRIILSKMDESRQFGAYVELAEQWNKPFSFFTHGQRVPDDYMPAEAQYLAGKIIRGGDGD